VNERNSSWKLEILTGRGSRCNWSGLN
jgi:hypothetical protein